MRLEVFGGGEDGRERAVVLPHHQPRTVDGQAVDGRIDLVRAHRVGIDFGLGRKAHLGVFARVAHQRLGKEQARELDGGGKADFLRGFGPRRLEHIEVTKARHERLDRLHEFGAACGGLDRAVRLVKEGKAQFLFELVQQTGDLGEVHVQHDGGARQTLRARRDDQGFPGL